MVSSPRLELGTYRLGGGRSVQLSYEESGTPDRSRTRIFDVRSIALCPLSYRGIFHSLNQSRAKASSVGPDHAGSVLPLPERGHAAD